MMQGDGRDTNRRGTSIAVLRMVLDDVASHKPTMLQRVRQRDTRARAQRDQR